MADKGKKGAIWEKKMKSKKSERGQKVAFKKRNRDKNKKKNWGSKRDFQEKKKRCGVA